MSQDPSNNVEDEQEQFTARRIQGVESGADESSMIILDVRITRMGLSVCSLTDKYFLT